MTCLQLLLNPGGSFQQTHTLLYREVTHCAVQGAVGEQTAKGLLALGAAAIVAQISPLQNAFGCIPRTMCETMEAFPGARSEPTDAAEQLGPAAKCESCYMQHFACTLSSSSNCCVCVHAVKNEAEACALQVVPTAIGMLTTLHIGCVF